MMHRLLSRCYLACACPSRHVDADSTVPSLLLCSAQGPPCTNVPQWLANAGAAIDLATWDPFPSVSNGPKLNQVVAFTCGQNLTWWVHHRWRCP
jgi:hypothetical protein